ncbi:helix-turn-helix domain-containing protein [Streptomyces sp. MAR25Y5]|uniref:helix-turn-helix domain-containing protein n=1 Tax=Streptomyces sp. MAR25Y5 TaxID=2962028 RepID=UPI0020B69E76|nr:helix-turn-helix domain-containing protein [Streptomyces sp. MAR25Y5]MCP3769505.1 helix-turn-helix domain-containing protein [Streptomyces sp. MAR25Y5]
MTGRTSDHPVSTPTVTSNDTPTTGYQIRRNSPDETHLGLIRPDGSVVIPPAVASDVLRALMRDLTVRVRADGGEVTPGVRRLLYALHTAAQRADNEHGSGNGTAPVATVTVTTGTDVSVSEAAALLGCTAGYVRRLARHGAFQARRIGTRTWAIDRASLDTYRHGEHAA